jgi:hypothetical protein
MARLVQLKSSLLLLLLLSVAMIPEAAAQTGKLAGTITDGGDGNPLPGVTVVLDGTTLGTVADSEGRYTVIGIVPGVYTVRFTFIGYSPTVVENVSITSDRTLTLDATMNETVLQAGELLVTAERPVVDPNQTGSRALVSGEEISRLPVTDLQDVIGTTSNSFEGFVRGSRRFETKTVLEGIDISDAFYALSEGDTYNGSTYFNANRSSQTDNTIASINPSAVSEVTVNSGAAPAQYGAATGGVVAIQLAEGRGPLTGSISARISPSIGRPGPDSLDFYHDAQDYFDDLVEQQNAESPNPQKIALYTWDENKYTIGDTPEYDIRANIGGSISDKWTFGLSGQFFDTHGYMPNYYRRRVNAQLKTTYALGDNTRLSLVGVFDDAGKWGGWNNRDYHEFWRFYLEGVAQNDAGSYVGSLKLTQVLNDKSFFDIQVYRTYAQTRYGYVDDDGNGFTDVGEDGDFLDFTDPDVVANYVGVVGFGRDEVANPRMFIDIVTDDFSEAGLFMPDNLRYKLGRPAPFQEFKTSITNGARFDYTNQVTFNHYVQAGAHIMLREFDFLSLIGQPGSAYNLNDAIEPFRVSDWDRAPWELGLYASDRIEFGGLKVNAGMRVEIIDRNTEEINNYFYPYRRDTIMVEGNALARNFFDRGDAVALDVLWNPSVGISHPISSRASMYFSLAHKEQLLPYNQLYRNYDGNHATNQFIAFNDPAQDPIISNEFEMGVQWEFAEGWGLDVNAYARAIENYGIRNFAANNSPPAGATVTGINQHVYTTDFGYGDARGIETVLRRNPVELADDVFLGLTASYTYSTVEVSVASEGLPVFTFASNDSIPQLPFDLVEDLWNYPQNVAGGSTIAGGYDRRHRGIVRATADFPYELGLGLVGRVESGFLYPRAVGGDPRNRALLTGPTNYTIDLRLQKAFTFQGNMGIDVYVDVTNLTNRQNVIAYDDNAQTGANVIFQETGIPGRRLIDNNGSSYYGPARTLYFGTRLRF